MRTLVLTTLCGGAVLVAGALTLPEGALEEPAQVVLRQSEAPAYSQAPDLRQRLAQQFGTVCQTPQGAVCTIAPQPINSRCVCGQDYGVVVR